ncbi:MAG: 16S rRNA (guanine(527)-N(7))-methyltransferase RsmG [Bacilli bacterium]|nr:16S rRNA (guanine(527)-N(7))-methyltransferase RsmG [Bacilli bacterium]
MNKEEFILETKKLGIELNGEQISLFEKYCEELLLYNEHTNLTAIRNVEDVYLKHFYDSITIVKNINLTKESVIDVGTGPGFPGVVLKIIFPEINLTLLDSNNKKTKFLKYICDKLGFYDVKIVNERIEDYVKNNRYKFDIATARAVSHLRIISELCLPLLKDSGLFVALKGEATKEIEESKDTLKVLNSEIVKNTKFLLPKENSNRTILSIKRNSDIPDVYPRSYDKILKKPLK